MNTFYIRKSVRACARAQQKVCVRARRREGEGERERERERGRERGREKFYCRDPTHYAQRIACLLPAANCLSAI